MKLVDPRGTSQTCPECGTIEPKTLAVRMHRCECGCVIDRNVAAARHTSSSEQNSSRGTAVRRQRIAT
ncbi:MAG: transposase [Alphaproteobacteria bacterium]|nr:transposase [Alphaproteobacteria bacterium]